MRQADILLVQDSFEQVKPIATQAATLFYDRLFEIAPEVRPLFRGDMAEQGRKLMATLAYVVAGLGSIESILPAAGALARRHVAYGVTSQHYASVGEALLWTLEKGLGPNWTTDTASAWTKAYQTLSNFMIDEAYGDPSR